MKFNLILSFFDEGFSQTHGFLIGNLGRDKVSAVVKGNLELPNDISGVVYVNEQNWQLDLAKKMKTADCNKLF